MILYAPCEEGSINISTEINSCGSDQAKLAALANHYVEHLDHYFRAPKRHTPTPSLHPSRPSFDSNQDLLKWLLEEAPQGHATSKEKALIRDGYHCVMTGDYDYVSVRDRRDLRLQIPDGMTVGSTNACHIFPELTNLGISGNNAGGGKHEYAATVWTIMERFGGIRVREELDGVKVHSLENIITMTPYLHERFDALELWFEKTDIPNRYKVAVANEWVLRGTSVPEFVTFTSSNPIIPLPSPRYLALHAAWARIVHLSGAGEYINKIFINMERLPVLADDGSSADVLQYALASLPSDAIVH
ncbi:hypothetical protein A0H81_13681 [Grifola frondosa]|uniref:HNH nuclease domain-containing protein n=1 Tax=Grifola frondosa TaxID=5627 RepID=A0A1C7LNK4_GRIFR|nr:hypothetical protein A0H81_13681 [Grifola frondosa]